MRGIPLEYQNMLKVQNEKGNDQPHNPIDLSNVERIVKDMKEN
jgi:hypothetical protein